MRLHPFLQVVLGIATACTLALWAAANPCASVPRESSTLVDVLDRGYCGSAEAIADALVWLLSKFVEV